MRARHKRLAPLVEHALRRSEAAEHEVIEARLALRKHVQQRDQLAAYRAEYTQPLLGEQSIGALMRRRGFLHSLDQALEKQQRQIERAQAIERRLKDQWNALRQRHRALQKVAQRLKDVADLREARVQERFEDDRVTARALQSKR